MDALELSTSDMRRLERIAAEAGRTPRAMLRYVLRDGFEFTEEFVRKVKEGLADFRSGNTVPHAQAMSTARAIIGNHAAARRKAA